MNGRERAPHPRFRARPNWTGAVLVLLLALVASGAQGPATGEQLQQHRNLGKAFYENPATQYDAVGELEKALALAPDSARERVNYGLALLRAGQAEKGIVELEKAQKQDPSIPHTWFNLGIALAAEGKDDEAVAAYEQALAHDQAHFGARKNLGLLLHRRDRVEPAREQLMEALELRPADAEIRQALADIARRTGDPTTCKTHVEAVLRQQPDDRAALELLEKCATPD